MEGKTTFGNGFFRNSFPYFRQIFVRRLVDNKVTVTRQIPWINRKIGSDTSLRVCILAITYIRFEFAVASTSGIVALTKSLKFLKFLLESICKTTHFSALQNPIRDMTQHNSFKASGGSGSKNRTVLKRFERVDLLKKRKEWVEGQRVVGLKKTKPEV